MINDKAVLVGVDGSNASYKATWWAANYAKHAGLTLQIVCAYSLPSYAAVSFALDVLMSLSQRMILPLIHAYLALTLSGALFPNAMLKAVTIVR